MTKNDITPFEAVKFLNAWVEGWTTNGHIITNPNPNGGIIDTVIKTGRWFYIPESDFVCGDETDTLAKMVEIIIARYEEKGI